MGIIDNLFGKSKEQAREVAKAGRTFELVSTYSPVFTTWQGKIYESELVRAAIDARARHASKLHVEFMGSGSQTFVNSLKKRPNRFATWSQFLYRVSTILDVCNNVIIVPVYDDNMNRCGIWCILPTHIELKEYKSEPWVVYKFAHTNEKGACPLAECAILNRFQFESDIWGESNRALKPTMQVTDLQNQAIKQAIRNSAVYKFLAQVDNFMQDEDLEESKRKFTERNFSNDANSGGLLLFPNNYKNIQQIKNENYTVDAQQAEFIRTNVFNYFGVNKEILQNSAIGDSASAFYEGFVEPFSIQFSETLTFMVYSEKEIAFGSKVFAYANRIQYMSMADKKSILEVAGDRGQLTINEAREILNLPPVDWGDVAFIRGEYYPTSYKLSDEGIEQTPTTEGSDNGNQE